jgi:hypothetical protein
MENKEINKSVNPEIEKVIYEKVKIEQTLQLLNKITVTGIDQSNIICSIFNLLNSNIKQDNK